MLCCVVLCCVVLCCVVLCCVVLCCVLVCDLSLGPVVVVSVGLCIYLHQTRHTNKTKTPYFFQMELLGPIVPCIDGHDAAKLPQHERTPARKPCDALETGTRRKTTKQPSDP